MILIYYSYCIRFEGNTMNLTSREKEIITSWFMETFQFLDSSKNSKQKALMTSELLYNSDMDGQTAKDWHRKCDGNTNTFSIIETEYKHIFGCFLSAKLSTTASKFIRDEKVFLCVIRSCFEGEQPEKFGIKHGDFAYANVPNSGPIFARYNVWLLGIEGFGSCNHSVQCFDGLHGNILCGGDQYEKTNEEYDFEIVKFNTFRIEIQD